MSLPVYNTQLLVQRDDVPALVINPNNPPPWLQNSTAQIIYVQNYVQPYMPVDQNVYLQQYVQNPMYVNVDPRFMVESNQIYQNPPMTQDKTNFMQIRPMRPTRSVRPRAYRQIQPRARFPNIQRVPLQMNEMNGLSNVRSMNVMNVNSANVRGINDVSMAGDSLNPNINRTMSNTINVAMTSDNFNVNNNRVSMGNVAINGAMTSDNLNLNTNRVTMGNVAINGAMASDNLNLNNNRPSMGNVAINSAMTSDNLNLNNNRVTMGNVAMNRAMTNDNINVNNNRVTMKNVVINGEMASDNLNLNMHRGAMANFAINEASNFNNPNNNINGVIDNSFNANENTIMTNVIGAINATSIHGPINASNRVSQVPNMTQMSINTVKTKSNAASNCDIGPNTLHRMTDNAVVISNVAPNSNLYLPSNGVNCINTPVMSNLSGTVTNVNKNDTTNLSAFNATVKNVPSLIGINANVANGAINIAKSGPLRNVTINKSVATVAKIPNSIKSIGPNSVNAINGPNFAPNSVNTIKGPGISANSVNVTIGLASNGLARGAVAANVNIVGPTKSTPTKVNLERNNPKIEHNKIVIAQLDNPNDVEDKPAQTESKDNTRNEHRKRKSESPDEIKSKLHVLDINEDKLQRKTVFTQARGRILNVDTKENIPIDEDIKKINKAFNKDVNDKDYVLTHVLDGFVIQESNVAFPIHKPIVEKTIRLSSDAFKDLEDEIPSVAIVKESNIQADEEKTNEKELLNEKKAKIKKTECLISDGTPFSRLTPAAIKNWTMEQLTNHLSSSGWKGTSSSFYEHEIDGESLLLVSKSQLLVIGVKEEQADIIIAFVNSGKS
ncbi:putative uncharacterized protein DDB_G0282133 [Pieris rapae]|uniref:putative uncharacterized protein DDB_G0282133 n=1 Tax=Pieris rapae TaxID=64459 RepID=UPI001E27B1D7|nr:putative uncharacterized protein DDB_G0282133 [Pieris rapae]